MFLSSFHLAIFLLLNGITPFRWGATIAIRIFDPKLRENFFAYVIQSIFATLAMLVVLIVLTFSTGQGIIIAAVGSSAFIVFAMPHYHTAKPRCVLGGHIVGVLAGLMGGLFLLSNIMNMWDIGYENWLIIASSISVGLSIFGMVITDTEHPPASGTALGIAVQGGAGDVWLSIVVIIVCATLLVVYSQLMKPWLKDLV